MINKTHLRTTIWSVQNKKFWELLLCTMYIMSNSSILCLPNGHDMTDTWAYVFGFLPLGRHACAAAQLCLTLCPPMDCSPPGSSVHGIFLAWILLQGIFLTQGLNLRLLHWQEDSLPLSHWESPPTPYITAFNMFSESQLIGSRSSEAEDWN